VAFLQGGLVDEAGWLLLAGCCCFWLAYNNSTPLPRVITDVGACHREAGPPGELGCPESGSETRLVCC
jgi:hypothetical protein